MTGFFVKAKRGFTSGSQPQKTIFILYQRIDNIGRNGSSIPRQMLILLELLRRCQPVIIPGKTAICSGYPHYLVFIFQQVHYNVA